MLSICPWNDIIFLARDWAKEPSKLSNGPSWRNSRRAVVGADSRSPGWRLRVQHGVTASNLAIIYWQSLEMIGITLALCPTT